MSELIVIAVGMHKVADIVVDVKYQRSENMVRYIPVEFEVFVDGDYYRAIPLQSFETKVLINLPRQIPFKIKKGIIYNYTPGTEKVVSDLVREMAKLNITGVTEEGCAATAITNTCCPKLS